MKAKAKILGNDVYPKIVRDELQAYSFSGSNLTTEIVEIKKMYQGLTKSWNAEKFYSSFYASVVLNSTKVFERLSTTKEDHQGC